MTILNSIVEPFAEILCSLPLLQERGEEWSMLSLLLGVSLICLVIPFIPSGDSSDA